MPVQFDDKTQTDSILEVVFDWATNPKGRRIQVYAVRRSLEREFGLSWLQKESVTAAFDAEKVTPEALWLIHTAFLKKAGQVRIG